MAEKRETIIIMMMFTLHPACSPAAFFPTHCSPCSRQPSDSTPPLPMSEISSESFCPHLLIYSLQHLELCDEPANACCTISDLCRGYLLETISV